MSSNKSRGQWWLTALIFLLIAGGSGWLVGTLTKAPNEEATPAGQVPEPQENPATGAATPPAEPAADALSQQWGISPSAIRLSAGGNVLDFRYQIVDVARAAKLSNPQFEAHVFKQDGNKTIAVNVKKAGPLVEGKQKLKAGDSRSIFFSNPGQIVKSGDLITVVIGAYRAENLTVQ